MPRRLEPLASPIHLVVDGKRVAAREGEPVAIALAASGRLTLGRSVKYHRPRGAACYVGRCDGCLMRVDGVPSVMTCRTPASEGLVVETQNVVGSAERDLLAATDWFFADRMNHHEMFTWNEQVNRVMQKIARRVAGVGRLPDEIVDAPRSEERAIDVLVVGGGPAGLRGASALARRGASVALVEEEPRLGGSLSWWPGPVTHEGREHVANELARALETEPRDAGVSIHLRAPAVAVYEPWESERGAREAPPSVRAEPPVVVVDDPERLTRFRPRRLVLATGRHEGASAFEGADRPGVIGVRAACTLLAHGVLPGERPVLAGDHPALAGLARALKQAGAHVVGPVPEAALRRAYGKPSVEGCELEEDGARARHECDTVVVGPPSSAVFELAAQAGVRVAWAGQSYELDVREDGETSAPDVRVIGWAANVGDLAQALAQSERAADAIARELDRGAP